MFSFNTADAHVSNLEPLNFYIVYVRVNECVPLVGLGTFP